MSDQIDWHELFGMTITDYFTGYGYYVEVEKDLSLKQQALDVLVVEQGEGDPISELPDGLENFGRRNLITYKSIHEPLSGWTLDELVGHYVNYRKQSSPSLKNLLPVDDFRLYAVSTRHPKKLESQVSLAPIKPGVYEVTWGSRLIRIIITREVPRIPRNAIWLLYSGIAEAVQFGASKYHWRLSDLSTVINKLYEKYSVEGIAMPYTVEDYKRDLEEEVLAGLTPEKLQKLLKKLPAEERLKGLPTEERLKGLPTEEIEAYLKKLSKSNRRPS